MAFSDISATQSLTGTAIDSGILGSLRDQADDEICDVLEANSLTIPVSSIPRSIKRASIAWTCRNVLRRQKVDGTSPNIYRAGNYYENMDIDKEIDRYDSEGRAFLDQYINGETSSACLLEIG